MLDVRGVIQKERKRFRMSDFYIEREVKKTRKDHKCLGCREKIPAGSSASYIAGTNGDGFSAYHLCVPCWEYLDIHPMEDYDFWCEGDLGDARRQEEMEAKQA